jgi:hypothetical protein
MQFEIYFSSRWQAVIEIFTFSPVILQGSITHLYIDSTTDLPSKSCQIYGTEFLSIFQC